MTKFSLEDARSSKFGNELSSLSEVTVDGIITTNWDHLIEELFPDYKCFIGQDELLFSNPQAIGEIYKIHGCASAPKSLILTSEDYKSFSEKNPYLAAKLVTIFVEHPIIFLGYSITDPHIRSIITSIGKCLPQEKISTFQNNLIFVQRTKGEEATSIEKTTIQTDEFTVTMTVIKTENFSDVYSILGGRKRKLPARMLRFLKEQIYDFVRIPSSVENKIVVVDYEEIESAEDVEFVVGVGVAKKEREIEDKLTQQVQAGLAKKGYEGVSVEDVFQDCLLPTSRFDAADLLASAYPGYGRSNRTFTPVFRYLHEVGITSAEKLAQSNYEGAKKVVRKMKSASYIASGYSNRYKTGFMGLSTAEIIEKSSSSTEAILMLAFQPDANVDIPVLVKFLQENAAIEGEPYKTAYKKLICRYDRLAFGFK